MSFSLLCTYVYTFLWGIGSNRVTWSSVLTVIVYLDHTFCISCHRVCIMNRGREKEVCSHERHYVHQRSKCGANRCWSITSNVFQSANAYVFYGLPESHFKNSSCWLYSVDALFPETLLYGPIVDTTNWLRCVLMIRLMMRQLPPHQLRRYDCVWERERKKEDAWVRNKAKIDNDEEHGRQICRYRSL